MKKFIFILVCAFATTVANAQIEKAWMGIRASYGFTNLDASVDNKISGSITGANEFSGAFSYAVKVSDPFYVEVAPEYSYVSKSDVTVNNISADFTNQSVALPINFGAQLKTTNGAFIFTPYVGVKARYHLSGEAKAAGQKFDIFDKDEVGIEANRFQFGVQVGLGFQFCERYYAGVSYCTYLNSIVDEKIEGLKATMDITPARVTLGINF